MPTRFTTQLAALVAAVMIAAPAPVHAETMSWLMTNAYSRAIVVELVSQARQHRWPGDGKVYLLEKGERKSVPIECNGGEKICYAAWVNGNDRINWGVGPDGDKACDDCCTLCAGSATQEIVIGE